MMSFLDDDLLHHDDLNDLQKFSKTFHFICNLKILIPTYHISYSFHVLVLYPFHLFLGILVAFSFFFFLQCGVCFGVNA